MSLRARFRGALVGGAVGDALGAVFEGDPPRPPESPDAVADHLAGTTQLAVTDDTLLTVALAESLLARGGIDEAHLARSFIRAYRREPDRGWGGTIPALLAVLRRGIAWDSAVEAVFEGQGSATDEAAMRVAPVALFAHADLERVCRLARLQARRTHAHPHAVDAAAVQALGVALALHTPVDELGPAGFLTELAAWTETEGLADRLRTAATLLPSADPGTVTSRLGTSALALEAVPTALASFLNHPRSVRQTVEFAIRLGGDTDTIAAMAATLCGALVGEEAIPPVWTQRVQAAANLRQLADELFDASAAANG